MTASAHSTNTFYDVHHIIYLEWIPSSYIHPYSGPTQLEQHHEAPQEPLQKCLIHPFQPSRRKSQLPKNSNWITILTIANGTWFCFPHQPRKLSKHFSIHNRTADKAYQTHAQTRNNDILIINLCWKGVKTWIDWHNWTNLFGIAKKWVNQVYQYKHNKDHWLTLHIPW